jgi:ABC-type lipoprotein export system ATPase subunit
MENSSEGSVWRRWDLHVHTPGTKLSDSYGGFEDNLAEFVRRIEACSAEVIGITDYFSIDAYKSFIAEYKKKFPNGKKVFFPNIEVRLSETIGKTGSHPDLHIIFDNDPSVIEKAESFLQRLELYDESHDGAVKRCSDLSSRSDFDAASVSRKAVEKGLKDEFGVGNPYMLAFPANNGGVRSTLKSPRNEVVSDALDKASDFFFGKMGNRAHFLNEERYRDGQKAEPKPVVSGSDAHSFEDLDRISHNTENFEFTWIKADRTFEGLRQILREPEDRVFIGEKPPKLEWVANNPTKIIKSVAIRPSEDKVCTEWFDCEMDMNSGLVAVIGNKGSGKSALADIIALGGDASCKKEDYSFLVKEKFLGLGVRTASGFSVSLTWGDGNAFQPVTLNENVDELRQEKVTYLPQSYLEKLCTDTKSDSFQVELERVIFSRLDETHKGSSANFKELLSARSSVHDEKIASLKRQILEVNEQIIQLRHKLSEKFKKEIANQLADKTNQLNAHDTIKPVEIENPDKGSTPSVSEQELTESARVKQTELDQVNSEILEALRRLTSIRQDIQTIKQLQGRLTNFKETFNELKSDLTPSLEALELSFDDLMSVELDLDPLNRRLVELEKQEADFSNKLNNEEATGLPKKREAIESALIDIRAKMDAPNKAYLKYLTDLKNWEQERIEITGSEEEKPTGTIEALKEAQDFIDNKALGILAEKQDTRASLATKLHAELIMIISDQNELYQPVKDLASNNPIIKQRLGFDFHSQLAQRNLKNNFLELVDKSRRGSFYGQESDVYFGELMSGVDFSSIDDILKFLQIVEDNLYEDRREGQSESVEIEEQLRQSVTPSDVYNLIWSLQFLSPELELLMDGKPLKKLSPGERCSILLVFYLLLDDSRKPIIIDQPEENLDNQTIFDILVPVIKEAKLKRQIVMITHNPNIAVVCDAEQIIHANINKQDGNKVTYSPGAIEAPNINKHIVDVLEGTQPAFDNRRKKYLL